MPQTILDFWFEDIDKSLWWAKDAEFDRLIIERFSEIHAKAICCELFSWRTTAAGRLAEIIVLDQFSRNIYRDSGRAFAYDALALALAQEAVATGADQELLPIQRAFLYMPFMHSESPLIHEVATELYRNNRIQSFLDFEVKHQVIIRQFGRYPHRNALLGRPSSAEEIAYLQTPGAGF